MSARRAGRPGGWATGLLLLAAAPAAAAQAPARPASPAPLSTETARSPVSETELGFIDAALAEGRIQAAQDLLARARAESDGPEVRLREAELLRVSSALPEAERAFAELVQQGVAAAGVGLGVTLMQLSRDSEAEAALAAALAADPSQVRGWSTRAILADRRRDWVAAEAHYARALALQPQSAVILNNRGWSRLLQGRAAEAEADLARAVALDGRLAAARTNLRLALALQGRYTEAFAGSTKAELANDLNTVGFAAMARGDLALAESYFSRALELNTSYDRAAAANLAHVRALAGQPTPPAPKGKPAGPEPR